MARFGYLPVMTHFEFEGVRGGQIATIPLGEKSWIKILRRPGRVELLELHVVFVEGTLAAGYPKLDVAEMAIRADAVADVIGSYGPVAADFLKILEPLRVAGHAKRGAPSLEDVMTDLIKRMPPDEAEFSEAETRARKRGRRRVLDDAFLRSVAEYRSEYGVAKTAEKFSTNERQVQRWLAEAKDRGIAYKGMRKDP